MGLKDVRVLAYTRNCPDVELVIEQVVGQIRCLACGEPAQVKAHPIVHYVDLPVFGTPMSLAWKKHRMRCANRACAKRTWVLGDHRIAAKHCLLTTRAARWATVQVGGGRTVKRWRRSSPVTGTRSTTRCSPMAKPCWRRIANG